MTLEQGFRPMRKQSGDGQILGLLIEIGRLRFIVKQSH